MSRPSTSRLGLPNGTPNLRQRSQLYIPEASSSRLATSSRHTDRKGKGKEKEKVKGRWEVGTKGWVKDGFRKFGAHCARNQIRTLLIDCLVMTNLFYPSVMVWYQKRVPTPSRSEYQAGPSSGRIRTHIGNEHENPLSVLSTPLLDSIFPDPPALLPRLSPSGWWYSSDYEDGPRWNITSVKNGDYHLGPIEDEEIRMVTIAWIDIDGALSQDEDGAEDEEDHTEEVRRISQVIQRRVENWEKDHPGSRERCVRELSSGSSDNGKAEGACHLFASSKVDGISKSFSEVATSNGSAIDNKGFYTSVSALFRLPRSASGEFGERWKAAVGKIADEAGGRVLPGRKVRKDTAEEYRLSYTTVPAHTKEDSSPIKGETWYAKYFIIGYIAMFIILVSQVNFATRVHSKVGLAITGIVQLCCSAIMSLSVLALIGWNGWGWSSLPSSVPAWVLPMVIVIVGVENMSTLTKAVFSVPFHYSVPERIGLGLSRSGLKILFTSLTNILALGIIWFFVDVGSVREFCLFAITVNITDWFMLHTFYLTVLSIDAQRLELADVLATSGNQDPATQTVSTEEADDDRHILSWRGILASRMFNSGTLILTLVCVGVIYYMTDRGASSLSTPASIYKAAKQTLGTIPRSNPFITNPQDLASLSTAESFWRSLNPAGWPFIRLVIPTASIIVLPTPGHPFSPSDVIRMATPARHRLPRLKPFFYLFKVVVLPQALTAGSLWALLAYLLKDADLLDAQRDRAGRGEDIPLRSIGNSPASGRITADQLRVDMLPCGHSSDIEVVASSRSGNLVISVGIDDSISLWRYHETLGTGTRESLRPAQALVRIVSAAISSDERFVSVATEGGVVQVWQLRDDGEAVARDPLSISLRKGVQINQHVLEVDSGLTEDPFGSTRSGSSLAGPIITVVCSDGSVTILRPSGCNKVIEASESTQTVILRDARNQDASIVVCGDYFESLYRSSDHWSPIPLHSHRSAGDIMTAISPLRSIERFTRKQVFAIGRQSGLVEIFDTSGNLIGAVGQSGQSSHISQVDVISPPSSRCSGCKVSSDEGFFVISTSSDQVYVDRVIPPSTLVCRCSASRRSLDEVTRLSISSPKSKSSELSLVVPPSALRARTSPSTSPRKSPSLLPPTSNGEFPLSSHGTRKLSAYQSHDTLASSNTTPMSANFAVNSMGLSLNGNGNGSNDHDISISEQSHSQTPTPDWTDMEVFPLGAITAPSGNWIVVNDILIGLRRSSPGINHDQWQLWTVDLTLPYNGITLNVTTASLGELEESTRQSLFDTLYSDGEISSEHKRTERLLSLSGRATFPPIRGSFSVPTFPTLAYIEIRNLEPKGNGFVAAFGNQLGMVTLPQRTEEVDQNQTLGQGYGLNVGVGMTPRSRLNSTSGQGANGNGTMLGLTPPPRNDKKSN